VLSWDATPARVTRRSLWNGSVNGAARKFTYEVSFPEDASAQRIHPRLWATGASRYLLDEIRLHGEHGELREEVTELARKL